MPEPQDSADKTCWRSPPRNQRSRTLPFLIPRWEAAPEALAYRQITVVKDEYGVSQDGMKMFGVMTLSLTHGNGGDAISLAIGLRNSHDKSFALGMVAGFRVFCCDNLA